MATGGGIKRAVSKVLVAMIECKYVLLLSISNNVSKGFDIKKVIIL